MNSLTWKVSPPSFKKTNSPLHAFCTSPQHNKNLETARNNLRFARNKLSKVNSWKSSINPQVHKKYAEIAQKTGEITVNILVTKMKRKPSPSMPFESPKIRIDQSNKYSETTQRTRDRNQSQSIQQSISSQREAQKTVLQISHQYLQEQCSYLRSTFLQHFQTKH